MRRLVGAAVVLLVATAGCSREPRGPFDGFRDLRRGQVISYRVEIRQQRAASGLGAKKDLPSRAVLHIEEEATGDERYAIVVRSVAADGEESQRVAAQRLGGRRLNVDLADGVVRGVPEAFSGTDDVAIADVALLSVLFAPVIPSPDAQPGDGWRTRTVPIKVPWSQRPLHLTVDNEVVSRRMFRELDVATVNSVALGNVHFRLPLVVPREPGTPPTQTDDLIVNRLFESLFSDIDNPVEGVAAAIAAIPLAIVAPFLVLGEAIADLFGGSSRSDEPELPVVDLSGPIELRTRSIVWIADGRILQADTSGTMNLSGRVPELPGTANELSGKTLRIDARWAIGRTHTSPFPEPRDPPGRGWVPIVATLLTVVALALVVWSALRRRRLRV